MASTANKVKFGLKNVHYAVVTTNSTGKESYGTPVAWPGAVNLSLDAEGDTNSFDADDIEKTESIYSRHAVYTLAIPKGDEHSWANAVVELPAPFAGKYRTIGVPTAGIEANIPLLWNMKVQVERYE